MMHKRDNYTSKIPAIICETVIDKFNDERDTEDIRKRDTTDCINIATTFTQRSNDNRHGKENHNKRWKWTGNYDVIFNNTPEYRRQIYNALLRPVRTIVGVDCDQLIEYNESTIKNAERIMEKVPRHAIPIEKYVSINDCELFRTERGYIDHPLSQQELNFPLAFGITIYKDVEQMERLLRAIYRPHNFYCIHMDLKMLHTDRLAGMQIAGCFDNVFIADQSIDVVWGQFSVLHAELLCMEKVWQYKKWKYYINLTGQEFPLKTNRELVAILSAMKGANIVDGTLIRYVPCIILYVL